MPSHAGGTTATRGTSDASSGAPDHMTQRAKNVGPQRYRETFGRYFGDFEVGDVYEHRPGKTVTEYENHLFTLLTLNTHPLHFDAEFGKATEFGRNLVVSTYTLSLLIGMSVTDVSHKCGRQSRHGRREVPRPGFRRPEYALRRTVRSSRQTRVEVETGPGRSLPYEPHRPQSGWRRRICSFVRKILIPAEGLMRSKIASKPTSRCPHVPTRGFSVPARLPAGLPAA